MRKYLEELDLKDELKHQLSQELGKQSIFAYQRINKIEEENERRYREQQSFQRINNVLILNNKSAESELHTRNKALMQGAYNFKFGKTTIKFKDKVSKIASEPTAYYLFKRRDLETKIDKLAIQQLRMAKIIHNVTVQARKDRRDYLRQKARQEREAERQAYLRKSTRSSLD